MDNLQTIQNMIRSNTMGSREEYITKIKETNRQIAEDIADGTLCRSCFHCLDDGSPGLQRTCEECQAEEKDDE